MSVQLKSFEGPDVQLLLDRIRAELGPGAKINGAEKIRVGGVLGFFAKEHYRVVVEAPAEALTPVPDTAPRLSRRERRQTTAGPEPDAQDAAVTAPAVTAPAVVPEVAVSGSADVFSAMAEATDDVNDVGALTPVAPPVAAAPEAVDEPAGTESFDAVLSRVATTLEGAPGPGSGFSDTGFSDSGFSDSGFSDTGSSAVEPDPPADELMGAELMADDLLRSGPPDIASKAALFLAETAPGRNGTGAVAPRAPEHARAGALRRVGLDDARVSGVCRGLDQGRGLEALLLDAFSSLAPVPPLPRQPGSLLVVVGAGERARRLAAGLADEMGLDPAQIPFASRHAEAYAVVTGTLLVRSAEDAAERAPGWRRSQAAVVVVDAPVTGSERAWATHVISALRPTAVWGTVDATSKTEDIAAWAETLGGIDALALEDIDSTVSPAAAVALGFPVARLNGQPATPARWMATVIDRVTP